MADGGATVVGMLVVLATAVFLLPAVSVKLPAATLTLSEPLASGVTTSVACVALVRVKVPLVPPLTTTLAAEKLVPTSSLKVKV